MIIKTENLTLRPWRDSDAECLYCFAKNPNIGPVAGWPPHESVEDSLNIIRTVFSKKETYAIVKDDIIIIAPVEDTGAICISHSAANIDYPKLHFKLTFPLSSLMVRSSRMVCSLAL